jgi:hypothetical protein
VYVYVLVNGNSAAVHEADDCTSLDVRVTAAERDSLDATLRAARLGSWDGGAETDLDLVRLQDLARRAATLPDWSARWETMIGYATTKGWVSADGRTVRAHVVGH